MSVVFKPGVRRRRHKHRGNCTGCGRRISKEYELCYDCQKEKKSS